MTTQAQAATARIQKYLSSLEMKDEKVTVWTRAEWITKHGDSMIGHAKFIVIMDGGVLWDIFHEIGGSMAQTLLGVITKGRTHEWIYSWALGVY
jgi:hypothetical protein